MPEVKWLPEAVEDARLLFEFLDDKSPSAAAKAAQALQKGANLLAGFPEVGRPMDDGTGRRELFIPFGAGAYVPRYILDAQVVFIIRAWHSKEKR